MKAPKKEEKPQPNPYTTFNQDHPEFFKWWKKHRHSGYVEDMGGKAYWNTLPAEAWFVDKYRVEFSIDTGSPYKSKHEYSFEEIEKWGKEQSEMESYVKGDFRCVPIEQFQGTVQRHINKLKRVFKERSDEAKTLCIPELQGGDITKGPTGRDQGSEAEESAA